jgi:glutamate/tyrosine decarboxylase-like PLP-dependent enzyme
MVILCSADNHYSVQKAANLLNLRVCPIAVDETERQLLPTDLHARIGELQRQGARYFIVVANMMTTMFGSVDDPDLYAEALEAAGATYRLHVDGAYGGFVYPFSGAENRLNFRNPRISSIALDAHKMLQAPYGTGIFLIRKGLMEYVYTGEASYVKGLDATLVGSRSGANAIAVWMILMTYGPFGWKEKIHVLQYRTQWLCRQLDELGVAYYRHPRANIVTIRADQLPRKLAEQYFLVPDNHGAPQWFKIVVMDHVTIDKLHPFVEGLKAARRIMEVGEKR